MPARRLHGEFFELNPLGTALRGRNTGRAYRLGDGIAVGVKFSHLVAINHIENGVLSGLEQKMTMRSGLIGEQRGTA